LLHHADAISLALKNWNDTEALKLLRAYWPEIRRALREPVRPAAIPVVIPHSDAIARVDGRGANLDEVIDRSANDDVRLAHAPLRTAP
jgi:hypothetical protein